MKRENKINSRVVVLSALWSSAEIQSTLKEGSNHTGREGVAWLCSGSLCMNKSKQFLKRSKVAEKEHDEYMKHL